jgi:hypothetical protein
MGFSRHDKARVARYRGCVVASTRGGGNRATSNLLSCFRFTDIVRPVYESWP